MKKITLFCDGSSLGNPGFGGWCAILRYKNNEKILKGSLINTTNNKMELTAVIEGLKALKEPCDVEIVSDSKYVCESINSWLENWIRKDFKNVKNKELWLSYMQISKLHKIKTRWVKGHNGHIENEQCDKIAKEQALILKDSIKGIK
ncbi:ribonuclease HI [Helicobacter sp. MIT 99-5507]|uniref:ribonuclease HI n=1 Tax=Helicobacter sp. MIT 99-5507 TaxID=152489 RepID=UPI000E1FB477|nr:ribonuclease HI [Helicobacter sp. MIT 99-5507]RDU57936.1 ribonuclease HI [Helicobacter sp. MIT 99-5507]